MRRSPLDRACRSGRITYGEVLFIAALVIVGAAILWFVGSRTNQQLFNQNCEKNLKQLGEGIYMYALDHDGGLPPFTNIESALAKKQKSPILPTNSDEPRLLREALRIYTDEPNWFCPADPVQRKAAYYLGIRHEYTSYAIPEFLDKKGLPRKLDNIPVDVRFGLVWDAAGDRSSCEQGLWFGGNRSYASNHPDGHVNFVLSDLSVRHLPAVWPGGGLLP